MWSCEIGLSRSLAFQRLKELPHWASASGAMSPHAGSHRAVQCEVGSLEVVLQQVDVHATGGCSCSVPM
jgi:hypothetical protein